MDAVGDGSQSVHLNDLQSYLVTFNKEIEAGDGQESFQEGNIQGKDPPVFVDQLAEGSIAEKDPPVFVEQLTDGSIPEKDQPVYVEQLTESSIPGKDQPVYVEQLTESVPQEDLVDGFVKSVTPDSVGVTDLEDGTIGEGVSKVAELEKHVVNPDELSLHDVQAQMVQLQDDVDAGSSKMTQDDELEPITITSREDSDDIDGKIVHVVSIDGQEHMHLVDAAQTVVPNTGQLIRIPVSSNTALVNSGLDQEVVVNSGIDSTNQVAVLASVAANTSSVNQLHTIPVGQTELNNAQLVALQNATDSTQPQLVAVQTTDGSVPMEVGTSEGLDGGANSIVLNTGGNNFQTVTIVPSEMNQTGEMSYVLIVSNPDKEGEMEQKQVALDMSSMYEMKEECREVLEEIIEEDGTARRVVRITPKKYALQGQEPQLMCNFCTYTSPKRYLLMRHMKSHSEDRPHKCNICDRGFKTMASLQNHVNTHTGTRPHKCKSCEAAFTTSGELVRHIRYRHSFEKPHKCTECDYASVELSKLKRHMRSHTGERPYHCPHCNYASPDTYKLKRHMRIHTGEKPYECDVCHARFTQSNSLKAHKLIHSGNKPVFQCELCPTTCGRKTDLKIHMQKLHSSEKPLCCRKCGSEFPDRYQYKLHMKSHEGEKCFKCEHCDYAAQSVRHLESHMLTHTGEKPFECDECELTFRQKQLLRRHKNLYHCPDYSPPKSRDAMYECDECDKPFTHKGNLIRHMQSHDRENTQVREHGGQRSKVVENNASPMTAEQLLQGSLLTEMREGKLGNTPKIVIVHPDGRVEEVTSKLQSLAQEKAVEELVMNITAGEDSNEQNEKSEQSVEPIASTSTAVKDEHKDVETQVALESESSRDSTDVEQDEPLLKDHEDHIRIPTGNLEGHEISKKRKSASEDSPPRKRMCEDNSGKQND